MKVHSSEITLGAIVRLSTEPYSDATVKDIDKDGKLTLFRPYIQTADFSCAGKNGGSAVICYIGIEEWTCYPSEFELVRNGKPLK